MCLLAHLPEGGVDLGPLDGHAGQPAEPQRTDRAEGPVVPDAEDIVVHVDPPQPLELPFAVRHQLGLPQQLVRFLLPPELDGIDRGVARLLLLLLPAPLPAQPPRLISQRLALPLGGLERRPQLVLLATHRLQLALKVGFGQGLVLGHVLVARLELGEGTLHHLTLGVRLLELALQLTQHPGGAVLAERHAALVARLG